MAKSLKPASGRWLALGHLAAKKLFGQIQLLTSSQRVAARHGRELRSQVVPLLDALSRCSPGSSVARRVLVDGMWYNPNYWFRYALCRRALGLAEAEEVGLLGTFARSQQRQCFDLMGIGELVDFKRRVRPGRYLARARSLVAKARTPDDLMEWGVAARFPRLVAVLMEF